MKLAAGRIDGFLARPDPAIRAALIYGPDAGMVREFAERLATAVAGSPRDPFLVAQLAAAEVVKSSSRLWDEAAALPMLGGRRVIRVRDAGDGVAAALRVVLDESPADALIVLEAGDLPARSTLRKLCEGSAQAAAIPCYLADAKGIAALAREMLGAAGLGLAADAERYLGERLTADRQLARRELEKLIAFAGDEKTIDLDAATSCIGDGAEQSLDDLVFAMADGDLPGTDAALTRLAAAGTSFVGVLRAVQRHLIRLHQAAVAMEAGASLEESMARLRPPVFFKQQANFRRQLKRWRRPALERALARLLDAEMAGKSTGHPADLIVAAAAMAMAATGAS